MAICRCFMVSRCAAVVAVFAVGAAFSGSVSESGAGTQYRLAWSDDFDGTALDAKRWNRCRKGRSDWDRHMSERADLVEVRDGQLVLWGKANVDTNADPRPYLTGGVQSDGKGLIRYGKVEIRAKFENQKGAWPAFWMLPNQKDAQGRGWPWGGEIDIVERLNGDDFVYQTVHSGWTYVKKHGKEPEQGGKASIIQGEWNVYGMEITKDALIWSVNGKETFRYSKTDCGDPDQWPFGTPFYVLMDMQLGGAWVGQVDVSTLPVRTFIDWIRVYEPAVTNAPAHKTIADQYLPPSEDPKHWWWNPERYRADEAVKLKDANVVWLGDSITHYWDMDQNKPLWNKWFGGKACGAPYLGLNFGIEGDTTENLLWRIRKSIGGLRPKVFIVNIGTNNTGLRSEKDEPAEDTVKGIAKVISHLRETQPQAKIILYALFPRGLNVKDPCQIRNERVNKELPKLCDGKTVFFRNINAAFLSEDGTVRKDRLYDCLHPSTAGYEVWLEDALPLIKKCVGE